MQSNQTGKTVSRFARSLISLVFLISAFHDEPAQAEKTRDRINSFIEKVEKRAKTETASASKSSNPKVTPTGKKVEVYELRQSSKMVGPISCLVSPQAVRIRAEKMGITWMFKAPKWEAYLFNTETKNFCSFPYDVWKDKVFFMPSNKTSRAKSTLANMKVGKTGKNQQIAGTSAYEVAITRPTGAKYGELWMASNIVAPKQFSEVVGSMVMVPIKSGGTPLRAALFQDKVGKIVQVFDTESVVKKSVDSSVFEPMKGYNKVKDEMALLFAESPDGSGSGMFDSDTGGRSPLQ